MEYQKAEEAEEENEHQEANVKAKVISQNDS